MMYEKKMLICMDGTRLCDYCPLYNVCGEQITENTPSLNKCGCELAKANATENNFLAWWSDEEQETYAYEHHENMVKMHKNAVGYLLLALYNGEHKEAEEAAETLAHWMICNNIR